METETKPIFHAPPSAAVDLVTSIMERQEEKAAPLRDKQARLLKVLTSDVRPTGRR
jgi:hypothetical protein